MESEHMTPVFERAKTVLGVILYGTYIVQSSSWEGNTGSASKQIPFILRYEKVHYHVQKGQSLVLVVSLWYKVRQ